MSREAPERVWLRHYRSRWDLMITEDPNSGDVEYVQATALSAAEDRARRARAKSLRDAVEVIDMFWTALGSQRAIRRIRGELRKMIAAAEREAEDE